MRATTGSFDALAPEAVWCPGVNLPQSHPLRYELHDEVHARPPLPLRSPARVSMLALLSPPAARDRELAALRTLAERHGVAFPAASGGHVSFDCGEFRVKWERHTEFSRYVFLSEGPGVPFTHSALEQVPAEWVAALPGELLHAAHAEVVPAAPGQIPQIDAASAAYFDGRPVVGSVVAGGAAVALTDFRIDANGFSRVVLFDRGLTPPQTGRAVQALFEVDTYRMLALLAFPMARELSPRIARDERELSEVANVLVNVAEADEPVLLDRLTTLQAHIERHEADNHYRFGAAAAYHELVQRRIAQLREERLEGLQTLEEFMERRLAPAMNTCAAVAARLESLSQRVSRATQLLSTRIEITRERQNQQLLESMDQRAAAQLRLQSTVEGLSVAAVTYYVLGIVNYLGKGLEARGLPVDPALVTALAIVPIAYLVWRGLRRARKVATRQLNGDQK